MSTTTERVDNVPAFRARSRRFDRVLRTLDDNAAAPVQSNALRAGARTHLLAERASADVSDDDVRGELTALSANRLGIVAEIPARDFGNVAVKLAVILVEGDNTSGAGGAILKQLHRAPSSALAELVILGENPLPRLDALMADDLERHKPGDDEAQS